MEDGFIPDMFVDTDYQVEDYQYKDIKQKCYCLKSGATDYDLTGQIIWRAATILAEYIIDNQEIFRDQNVLELGAGAGISGLVCSQFSKKVYITDGNEIVTDLMEKNLEFSDKKNVEAEQYLWGKEGDKQFLSTKPDLKIDVVIGADILFWPEGIAPLAESLETYYEMNKDLKVFISSRLRSQWVERQFETELFKRNMMRIKMFEEGENKFFEVKIMNEQEQKDKQEELNEWERKAKEAEENDIQYIQRKEYEREQEELKQKKLQEEQQQLEK